MGSMRPRRKPKSVYAFIDSQNLNQSIQRLGWKMDWRKFRQFLNDKYGVTHAYMFIGYVPEFEAMYEQLHESGYLIVLKPTYDMTRPRPEEKKAELNAEGKKVEDEEKKPTKGNIDADLVLWAMKELPNYSQAVIVSGDGDFYSLVEYLDERKKLAKILAPSMYYSGLYNRYDNYIERIDLHRKELSYWDGKKTTTQKF